MEREACPQDDRGRQRKRNPLPAAELQRRHHRQQDQWNSQRYRSEQTGPQRANEVGLHIGVRRKRGRVSGGLHRAQEIGQEHVIRVVRNRCKLSRVVDARRNALELVELLLHPRSARGAGHAADLELDAVGALDRHQAAP